MTEEMVLSIAAEALKTSMFVAGPMLIAAMLIGVVVSILQAVTQINEATLTFIPKIVGVVLVLAVMAPWMLRVIEEYTTVVLGSMGDWIR